MKERGVGHSEKLKSELLRHHTLYNHAMKTSSSNFFVEMSAAEYRSIMGFDTPRRTPEPEKKNKYGAKRVELDGLMFDSKKECAEWAKFCRMEAAGVISNLKRQTSLDFFVKGKKMFTYKPDMEYDGPDGHHYIDVKSPATAANPLFRLKRRIIEAEYGIKIEII